MIRAIFDTNIWISFLLGSKTQGTIAQIVNEAFSLKVELIVPQELIAELHSVFSKSRYVSSRIRKHNFDELLERLGTLAIVVPILPQQGKFTRDPKDDYLIVYSLSYAVDYLVTGDQDLLALNKVENLQIITPNQFLEIVS